ncbi:MAG TPA: hypothetical protein VM936_09780, partial [Pyrinomonadaceae bacterium]|nr:hypothetical protein [Pyrinomonadaceae bacterium]
ATEGAEVFGGGHSQESDSDVGPSPRPSYSSGYSASTAQQAQGLISQKYSQEVSKQSSTSSPREEEPKGPGLIGRFKETKAYDRLTDEISTLGERVVEELSSTARTVVVPMLLNKLKGLIGVDLSGQQRGGARQSASGAQAGGGQQQSQGFASSGAGAQGAPSQPASGSTSDAAGSASGGSSARAAGAGGTEGYGAS